MNRAAVETSIIAIPCDASQPGPFDGYLARPAHCSSIGVLLLPEMFGLTQAMLEAAEGFAASGYAALVPNVFWRSAQPGVLAYEGPERQTAWERLQALDFDTAVRDIACAVTALSANSYNSRHVVAVGHCIGGRLAVLALPQTELAGAVSYYGLGISHMGNQLATLAKPVQLHYGLADEHVPLHEIEAVVAAAHGNLRIQIHRYAGAGHSFCNPYRPMHDRTASSLVRERTETFLQSFAGDVSA